MVCVRLTDAVRWYWTSAFRESNFTCHRWYLPPSRSTLKCWTWLANLQSLKYCSLNSYSLSIFPTNRQHEVRILSTAIYSTRWTWWLLLVFVCIVSWIPKHKGLRQMENLGQTSRFPILHEELILRVLVEALHVYKCLGSTQSACWSLACVQMPRLL